MISSVSEKVTTSWSVDEAEMPVSIQWHISDHSGLSRDGASGSVRVIVYVTLEIRVESEAVLKVTLGVSCNFFGFSVFPRSADSPADHSTSSRKEGRNSSTTMERLEWHYFN